MQEAKVRAKIVFLPAYHISPYGNDRERSCWQDRSLFPYGKKCILEWRYGNPNLTILNRTRPDHAIITMFSNEKRNLQGNIFLKPFFPTKYEFSIPRPSTDTINSTEKADPLTVRDKIDLLSKLFVFK